MKIQNAVPLVNNAFEKGYAVPAFNANGGSYDIVRAALEAAEELRSPMILQEYEPNCEYRGFKHFSALVRYLCEELQITVPVAIHLDHGHSFNSVVSAMGAGFTSVMFDASHDPLESNIAQTKKVIEVARALGASVEAEVGYVKGNEPKKEKLIGRVPVAVAPIGPTAKTDIAEAVRFVKETDVDMLAVAVGTTHGVYQQQTVIDYDLLRQLRSKISKPLVQHGTCGISLEDLTKLSKAGMAKVNFGEGFRFSYIKYFNELTDNMEHLWHCWRIMREVKNKLKADMKDLICALGSDGKADSIKIK